MKLAYLVSQYPGINHSFLLREIRQLRARGWDIQVISVRAADRPRQKLTPVEQEEEARCSYLKPTSLWQVGCDHLAVAGSRPLDYLRGLIEAVRLAGYSPSKFLSSLAYFVEAVVAGRRMVAANIRHFHAHFTSTVGLLITRVFPLSMSVTFHGHDELQDPAGFHLAAKVAGSSFVCAISHHGASRIRKACDPYLWSRIEVARLGVNPADFTPSPVRETHSSLEIICVARLAPVKAHPVLLDAFTRLVREGQDVRLNLVGDGPDRAELEARCARAQNRRVVFHGWRNYDEVVALYRRTDIAVLASFDEGIPVALMEAMAMQIPCVATNVGGLPELIQDGVNGLLVSAFDVEGLAQALARLIGDPSLRNRLGQAARERILCDFDLLKNIDRLAEIFTRRLA